MPLEITSHSAIGKSVDFVDVTTFFDNEPSCFNFEVRMMRWLCGAKFEGAQGIDFKKLQVLKITSVPLL
jgi:hypothetical protein